MTRRIIVAALVLGLAAYTGIPATASAVTPRSTNYLLNPNGTSHLDWAFMRTIYSSSEWHIVTGSSCHYSDEAYAQDWNWGVGAADLGKTVYAVGPGTVLFAGNNGSGWGNQVIVEFADNTSMAVRFAHLATVAVSDGDYVHFGSEVGTVGDSGGDWSPHLHLSVYRNIGPTQRSMLESGYTPTGANPCQGTPATNYAAQFELDGSPYSLHPGEEDLPCTVWNGDVVGCDAHSILWGGKVGQDCAYYWDSGLCLPRGTSNCRAHIESYCWDGDFWNDSDASLPCHYWDGDLQACDAQGWGASRDCAYYVTTNKCRPRGTNNCLAGIQYYCSH